MTCDLQFLRGADGHLVLKEFSVYFPQSDVGKTVTFLPPYDEHTLSHEQRRQNRYVTGFIHGMGWSSGEYPYSSVTNKVREMLAGKRMVYVKGAEKVKFLQPLAPFNTFVVNIECEGCPQLKRLPRLFVENHGVNTHSVVPLQSCAALNAKRIGLWMEFMNATNKK